MICLRHALATSLALWMISSATVTAAVSQARDEPTAQELEEQAKQWSQRKRRGAYLWLGAAAFTVVVVGSVRMRGRRARKRSEKR